MRVDLGRAIAADDARGRVEAHHPAVGTDDDHDGPDRVEDGGHEVLLIDQSGTLEAEGDGAGQPVGHRDHDGQVGVVERPWTRGLDVEHPEQAISLEERHAHLAPDGRVAHDVIRVDGDVADETWRAVADHATDDADRPVERPRQGDRIVLGAGSEGRPVPEADGDMVVLEPIGQDRHDGVEGHLGGSGQGEFPPGGFHPAELPSATLDGVERRPRSLQEAVPVTEEQALAHDRRDHDEPDQEVDQ